MDNPLALYTDTSFNASEWIGQGKKWAENLPREVVETRDVSLEVPEHELSNFPVSSSSVEEFLSLKFPYQSSQLNLFKPNVWFQTDEPYTPLACLMERPIPSKDCLDGLFKAFNQSWLDGAKSIADPRYNDGGDRFPLYVLSFWRKLAQIGKDHTRWKHAYSWAQEKGMTTQAKEDALESAITEARKILACIGWRTQLTFSVPCTTTLDLIVFLGARWLTDDHLDMMLETLRDRAMANPKYSGTMIAPITFSWAVSKAAQQNDYSEKGSPLLCKYARKIRDEPINRLYFPLNVNENHWIAGFIDFRSNTMGYGDSLVRKLSPPMKFFQGLRKWMKAAFGREATFQGDRLDHGLQDDAYSCGICAVNTIAHAVFGDALWIPRLKMYHRVRWFVELSKYEKKEPSQMTSPPEAAVKALEHDIERSVMLALPDFNFNNCAVDTSVSAAPSRLAVSTLLNPLRSRLDLSALLNPADDELSNSDDTSDDGENSQVFEMEPDSMEGQDMHNASQKRSRPDSDIEAEFFRPTAKKAREQMEETPNNNEFGDNISSETSLSAVGISRAATWAREANAQVKNGSFKPKEELLSRWKAKLREYDPNVAFDEKDPTRVKQFQHSLCKKWLESKNPYDTTRFIEHLCNCTDEYRKKHPAANTKSIQSFFTAKPSKSPARFKTLPCPGLTDADDSRISRYLSRSGASGGGSPSVSMIATELFGTAFSELDTRKKKHVIDVQTHAHCWRNDHTNLRIFSTSCKKSVTERHLDDRALPCPSCSNLLRNNHLSMVLQKKIPLPRNLIYTNFRYRNQLVGHIYAKCLGLQQLIEAPNAKNTPLIRYAIGALSGKYKDEHLSGIIQVLVLKRDREERGVSLRGFRYPPAWDELSHLIRISSPKTYRLLQHYLPMRTERSFRQKEARQPRFPPDLSSRTFEQLREQLKLIAYDGQPSGLSCDDTKLKPSLRVYYDSTEECHFVVGAYSGPVKVLDPDELEKTLDDLQDKKATKVRLWVLTIGITSVTPIILAAKAISNLDADTLTGYSMMVIHGLIKEGVKVISYSCDGTEVERCVQRQIMAQADRMIEEIVHNPRDGTPDTIVRIAVINEQPICMIQDSKHALKTFRNNLFSGARLLCLGNFIAIYEHIRQLAHEDGSPIYIRDVEKLDRQDDAAATRLFSADTLEYLSEAHPEYIGEIVYLFVFGELVDAYQNRTISHHERVKMVLRARYFLNAWDKFLSVSQYPRTHYFLSREALDIAGILIEGYLSLVTIHRDHLTGLTPLLPWLHASEGNEHTFGDARQIDPDFAFLDFIYMVPKLRLTMCEAVHRGRTLDPKARASGYLHTYFDSTGLDILSLAMFPTREEMVSIAELAADEADSLMQLLGIKPKQLQWAWKRSSIPPSLPSIDAGFPDEDFNWVDEDSGHAIGTVTTLQTMLDQEEDLLYSQAYTTREEAEVQKLSCVAISLMTENIMRIQQFCDVDPAAISEVEAQEFAALQKMGVQISRLQLPDEKSRPLGQGIIDLDDVNFNTLVDIRCRNQTAYAARGTRVAKQRNAESQDSIKSLGRKILTRYNSIMKESQDRSSNAGASRHSRWTSAAKGDGSKQDEVAGNSANAQAVAVSTAKKASVSRKKIFSDLSAPRLNDIINAQVTAFRPLRVKDYGILCVDGELFVGKVIALYEKTGGKNGKHASITESSNISAISYIDVQLFERSSGRRFVNITTSTAVFNVNHFAHVTSVHFLSRLTSAIQLNPGSGSESSSLANFTLHSNDEVLYCDMKKGLSSLREAMKRFRKRSLTVALDE